MKFNGSVVLFLVALASAAKICTAQSDVLGWLQKAFNYLVNHAECRRLNFDEMTSSNQKDTLTGITGAFTAAGVGPDVYVTSYSNQRVYRFKETETLETLTFPVANPSFIDVYNGFFYVTSYTGNIVYKKPLTGGDFSVVLNVNRPVGIKWSPDGEQLLVGEGGGTIHVYNKDLEEVNTCL